MIHPDRARFLPFILLVVGLTLTMPRASAAPVQQVRITHAERIADQLILDVSMPGGPELRSDSFDAAVNGLTVRDVRAASRFGTELPTEIVLVVDTSGSMEGEPLAAAKAAVVRFLDRIQPNHQVALVRFSSTAQVVTRLTTDYERVSRDVQALKAYGETAVFDGIVRAVELDTGQAADRNIVVLSDGTDTASKATFARALSVAQATGAVVSVVGIKSPEYAPRTLEPLATRTGGVLIETTQVSKLSSILESLATTLVSSYRIEMTDPDPLSRTSQVQLEVENQSTLMRGSRTFSLPVPVIESDSSPLPFDFEVPAVLFLAGVFLGVGTLTFIATERLRRRKISAADRIAWYEDPNARVLDTDNLINAAVLQRAKDLATHLADRTGYLERIEREIEGAGMKWRPGEAIVASLLLSVVGGLLGFAIGGWIIGLLFTVVGAMGPKLFIKQKASARRKAFYKQLTDILMLLTGGLRAGYSMQQAAGAVAEDAPPPASEEFRRVMAEVRLGASLEDSLKALGRRVNIVDFDWTVLAIEIQREVGGDLAEILETIAETIRSRERLHGKVKTLTAEGRLSGWVLGSLPFGMAGLISLKSPEYLTALYQSKMGLMMIGGSVFMMIIGILWMKKIVNIEV